MMRTTTFLPAVLLAVLVATLAVPAMAQMAQITVKVMQFPKEARPGDKVTVTWEVTGEGNIAHTSTHWGTKPGVEGQRFYGWEEFIKDYAKLEPAVKAPKTFTGSFTAPSSPGTIYFRSHAIVDGKSYWTAEMTIKVEAAMATPTRPPEAMGGQDNTLLYAGLGIVAVVIVAALALKRKKPKKESKS